MDARMGTGRSQTEIYIKVEYVRLMLMKTMTTVTTAATYATYASILCHGQGDNHTHTSTAVADAVALLHWDCV